MFKKLKEKKFFRNVVTVVLGASGAQLITMIASPIITRLYGPEIFGIQGTFLAILAVLMPIAALTYPIAIVLPKSDSEALAVAKLSVLTAVIISILVTLIVLLFGKQLAAFLGMEGLASLFILIPLAMFFSSLHQIAEQWLFRKQQFTITARAAIFQSISINAAKVGFGLFHPVVTVLVVLSSFGNGLHALLLWLGIQKQKTGKKCPKFDKNDVADINIRDITHKYRDFPLFRSPQVLVNGLSQSMPVLMLASLFSPSAAGFYTIGKMVLGVPANLIGKAVGDVFYPRITSAAHSKENLFRLLLKATVSLALVGLIPFGFVIIFGPWLFAFVFGEEWFMAGEYARWISIWMYFMFMNSPCNKAIPVLSIQGFYLIFTICTAVLRFFALFIGYYLFSSDLAAIAFFGVAGAIVNIFIISLILYLSKSFDEEVASRG